MNKWMVLAVVAGVLACAAHPAFAVAEALADEGLNTLAAGYKAKDKPRMEKGLALLERAAGLGNGEAAFTLAAFYSGVVTSDTADKAKSCVWTLRAAQLKHVEAYFGAAHCALREATPANKTAVFESNALPWLRRLVLESTDVGDVAEAQRVVTEWNDAKSAHRNLSLNDLAQMLRKGK